MDRQSFIKIIDPWPNENAFLKEFASDRCKKNYPVFSQSLDIGLGLEVKRVHFDGI